MNTNLRLVLTIAAVGAVTSLRAEPPEVTLKIYSKEFIYFSDETESFGGSVPSDTDEQPTPDSGQSALSSFSVSFRNWPAGIHESPEARMQVRGITYILPPRKIVVPGPKPKGDGVFVNGALDPNGSGNFEVVLVTNMSVEKFEQQGSASPEIDEASLPKGIKMSGRSSSSSYKQERRELTLTFILRNDSGQPFVLKPECFKKLPETRDWPLIEIPPIRPQA